MKKTINFANEIKCLPQVIDRDVLASKIALIPPDIIADYAKGMQALKAQIDESLSVVHASGAQLCTYLLEEMSDEQVKGISKIVDVLGDREVLNKIDQLINLSLNLDQSKCSDNKINEAIESIKSLDDSNLEKLITKYLYPQQLSINILTKILLFYVSKQRNEDALRMYLEGFSEIMIDDVIQSCETCSEVCKKLFN